jgi:hypothetical protein
MLKRMRIAYQTVNLSRVAARAGPSCAIVPRMQLGPLPPTYVETREALRALACYVLAPARKAVDGRIGLRATGDGFGTPLFGEHARRLIVRANQLVVEEGGRVVERQLITTVRAAAALTGNEPVADPGVGHDLPPFDPDAPLDVDPDATDAIGRWYALVDMAVIDLREELVRRGRASEPNLWPEHFDLAFDWGPDETRRVNLGGSPGDMTASADPYLYVGPWDKDSYACDRYWNAPFGAVLSYADVAAAPDPRAAAVAFFHGGIERLGL